VAAAAAAAAAVLLAIPLMQLPMLNQIANGRALESRLLRRILGRQAFTASWRNSTR